MAGNRSQLHVDMWIGSQRCTCLCCVNQAAIIIIVFWFCWGINHLHWISSLSSTRRRPVWWNLTPRGINSKSGIETPACLYGKCFLLLLFAQTLRHPFPARYAPCSGSRRSIAAPNQISSKRRNPMSAAAIIFPSASWNVLFWRWNRFAVIWWSLVIKHMFMNKLISIWSKGETG